MNLAALMKADASAILVEIGVPITVRLAGVEVKTVTGGYFPEAETVSGYELEKVVVRPMVVLTDTDAADITRNHTLQAEGQPELRLFGDPRPGGAGLVKLFLVK